MTTDPTAQTLTQIQATNAEAIASRFAEVRFRFDEEVASHSSDLENWKAFVVKWIGRKAGVLTAITDNWLKPAPPELKRVVGQELNQLKGHVELTIAEKQKAIEAAAEDSAQAREENEVALPGIWRGDGTR